MYFPGSCWWSNSELNSLPYVLTSILPEYHSSLQICTSPGDDSFSIAVPEHSFYMLVSCLIFYSDVLVNLKIVIKGVDSFTESGSILGDVKHWNT